MKKLIAVLLLAASFAVYAQTRTIADQGKPGTYGPWPVTTVSTDGVAVIVQEQLCANPLDSVLIFDGGAATPCPVTAVTNRRSVTLCNSQANTGSPVWWVSTSGQPTAAVTSPGQVLDVGDCVSYAVGSTAIDAGSPLWCVSSLGNSALSVTECR